jgi:hypothetical protein
MTTKRYLKQANNLRSLANDPSLTLSMARDELRKAADTIQVLAPHPEQRRLLLKAVVKLMKELSLK